MEHQPPHPDDHNRDVPELERLYEGEIDLTGAVEQEDSLRDVIGDAIGEADDDRGRGQLPDWGARTMARALANRLDDPVSGGLHHFAVTGRADKDAIARDLVWLYNSTSDEEIHDWINRLGTYVLNLPEPEALTAQEKPGELPPQMPNALEPASGTPMEEVSAFFRVAFEEADARGEAITADDARAIASVLSGLLLDPNSEMARFADTGDANPVQLHEECQLLKRHQWRTADVGTWIERFEQHLATRADLGRQPKALPSSEQQATTPRTEHGVHEHDDAFRAYLTLPDVDAHHPDVRKNFRDVYIGSFNSIDQLVTELTDLRQAMTAIRAAAEGWGLADYVYVDQKQLFAMACETWDIVFHRGTFHVFMK